MTKAVAIATNGEEKKQNPVTGYIERASNFLTDVRSEMRKVVTPTRDEVQSTTTVVIIAVFLFAAFFYVVDGIAGHLIERILHYLSGGR